MNKDDTIWKAGITWNTQSLTGNALDLYITNNYFDFFPTPAVENKKEPDTQNYFSKQKELLLLINIIKNYITVNYLLMEIILFDILNIAV